MLSHQQASELLQTFAVKTDPLRSPGSAARLLTGPREAAFLFKAARRDADADLDLFAIWADAAPERRRRRAFKVLTPSIAAELDRLWTWAVAAPYQGGWERRPFRSEDPADSRGRRAEMALSVTDMACRYPQDVGWLARWAPHVGWDGLSLGHLFASEISHGNTAVANVLVDSAQGRDEVGAMGTHVVVGLLGADDPAGWTVVEDLLVRAQRQEGLRQVVLESVDFAQPAAFRRMLDVILEHGLTRFAATVRAAGVWFGEQLEVRQDKQLAGHLDQLRGFLDRPPSYDDMLALAEPAEVYLALWSRAFVEIRDAVEIAGRLLGHEDSGVRLAATRILVEAKLPDAVQAAAPALGDRDLRVVAAALRGYPFHHHPHQAPPALDEIRIAHLLDAMGRVGKTSTRQIGLLGSAESKLAASTIADVLIANTPPEHEHLITDAHAKASADGRNLRVFRLAQDVAGNRAALFAHVGDAAKSPRALATGALLGHVEQITEQEAVHVESLLTRRASDLRRGCMELLQRQDLAGIAASVERLRGGTESQVTAGDELAGGATDPAQPDHNPKPVRPPDLVVDHSARTPSFRPTAPPVPDGQHERCARMLTSLVGWLDEHKDVEVRVGSEVQLLADLRWLPRPTNTDDPLPLEEILGPWWERTRPTLTDGGLECALVATYGPLLLEDRYTRHPEWLQRAAATIVGALPARHLAHPLARAVLGVLARHEQRAAWVDPLLDARATMLAALPEKPFGERAVRDWLEAKGAAARSPWQRREQDPRGGGLPDDGLFEYVERGQLSRAQLERLWQLRRFLDEPAGRHVPGVDPMVPSPGRASRLGVSMDHPDANVPLQANRMPPDIRLAAAAFEAGVATEADLLDQLTLPSETTWGFGRRAVDQLTARLPEPWVREATRTTALVARVTESALAFEVHRGEHDTDVSDFVAAVRTAYGVDTFVAYLAALGGGTLARGYAWTRGRDSALSRVIRKVSPAATDTVESFAGAVAAAGVKQKRLVEVGVYAPQWAGFVEQTLDWPGYEDAVWWLHAHTKGEDWTVDRELLAEWAAQVSQRTPLDAEDLTRGAVDVDWFRDVLAELGEERFETLLKAAKYASTSGGHKRAELFAKALRGQVEESELRARIADKRHQDSVRALGLLPLGADRDATVLDRYELLRGFVATDRTSGSQRRASESTAVDVGLENLARTAGYRDPQRLVWAMEAHAVRDLTEGPVTATDGDLTVTLSLDGSGSPDVQVRRGERSLASIPQKSAKLPEVAELKARVSMLRKQASRMRRSLEQACVTGETFAPAELEELLEHPMIRPMVRDLVLVDDTGTVGFAGHDAGSLLDEAGVLIPAEGALRIAHPLDLLRSGRWPDLQHALFSQRRKQPFRQAFRELYTVTDAERDAVTHSRRYAGHQVQSRQAAALFGGRGWVADFEVGFGKTFHAEKLTAWCSALNLFGTPGEVEDATIDVVTFHPARSWQPIPLEDVPPRLFSEVMRDLDLVVSVAHSGGVDPESSESSVEMRARLVEESCTLLGLDNVETTDHHALVKGKRATYSVNLGSGVVHRQPGSAVCIVPVSAQHRGRVFLPFVDDDPRTAEVISKVLMLARDDKITDPTILAQLR